MGAVEPQGAAGEEQVPALALRGDGGGAERNRKIDLSEINIPAGPRLGDIVLEADSLKKGFDDRVLMHDLDFKLPRAGIVGVIGPNGVGRPRCSG